jgi:O-acetyl-ADP-ribose deacetylase (regulator of RNase III)
MIEVLVDDLARVQVDAVLRPADAALEPVTPVAARLDQAGGPRFESERRITTPLEAGAAVVTGGGDLAAPFVVHVVIRDPGRPVVREHVRRALVSAWQRAGDWGLMRIAAPLVGAGAGLLGEEEAARLLVDTVRAASGAGGPIQLRIGVEKQAEKSLVEAIVGRGA